MSQHKAVGSRLSLMMFLEFFIWGAWYTTAGNFMNSHDMKQQVYLAYMVGPLAAILSPFFLGMVADRFFATERVLAAMHLLGGVVMFCAPLAAKAGPWAFIAVLLVHMLCYMPTLGLTNTLAFHNITDQEKQFPIIRVFGTIGWIAGATLVSKALKADYSAMQFYVTGAAAVVLGLYSLTLPHTPPPAKGQQISVRAILGLDALKALSSVSFWVFIVCSFLICIPLAAYFAYVPLYLGAVGYEHPGFITTFGQMSEIIFMLLMPLFFSRLGVKWMLTIGMAAWVARYGLFSWAAPGTILPAIFIGVVLHGICYDFFFVTGFIYTDKKCTPAIRGQAQGLLVLVTQGLGLGLGALISGHLLYNRIVQGEGRQLLLGYQKFWLILCLMAAVVMVLFFLLFWEKTNSRRGAQSDQQAGHPAPADS